MKKFELKKAKAQMLNYKDFFGGDFIDIEKINEAKNKKSLNEIFVSHSDFLRDQESDAQSHLENFKKKLGVTSY